MMSFSNAQDLGIASDHAGKKLKEQILKHLSSKKIAIYDFGVTTDEKVDYPDYAEKVSNALQQKKIKKGILICGSGIGMAIAANKFSGVRASVVHDLYSARQGVEHDDLNVLVLGEKVVDSNLALKIVDEFLAVRFSENEHHKRRLEKIKKFENRQ